RPGRSAVEIKGMLGSLEERLRKGPARRRVEEGHDAVIARSLPVVTQVDELDELDRNGIARALSEIARLAEMAIERRVGRLYGKLADLRCGDGEGCRYGDRGKRRRPRNE